MLEQLRFDADLDERLLGLHHPPRGDRDAPPYRSAAAHRRLPAADRRLALRSLAPLLAGRSVRRSYCQGVRAWPATQPPRLPGRGEPLRLYDSSSREIRPAASGPLARMYVCGITPYDATHLGHALTYVTFDLVQRALLDAGVEVSYVQNVTDVDEPLLERAERDGVDWRELALAETERFRQDMTALRVIAPQAYIGAVEAIPLIIPVIEKLLADGNAYVLDGDIYFAVDTAAHFGSVAGLPREQMLALFAERGGDPDRPGKHDPLDPVLWRGPRPGEPSWEAPFGPGRPGWHVECAAIALEHLGSEIDIQGGGSDLAYPHHECSASHAGAFSGRWPFARQLRAFRDARVQGHQDVQVAGQPGLRFCAAPRRRRPDGHSTFVAVAPLPVGLGVDRRGARRGHRPARSLAGRGRAGGRSDGANVLARVRACLADDLDAPSALAALDGWANGALAGDSSDPEAPALVRAAVDALLGIEL